MNAFPGTLDCLGGEDARQLELDGIGGRRGAKDRRLLELMPVIKEKTA